MDKCLLWNGSDEVKLFQYFTAVGGVLWTTTMKRRTGIKLAEESSCSGSKRAPRTLAASPHHPPDRNS
jgi:hypothetical protein